MKHFTIGITLTDDFTANDYSDFIKKEYELSKKEIAKLKPADLFNLEENIKYWQFEGDCVLLSEKMDNYYHLSSTSVLNKIDNDKIIGFLDSESNEIDLI